MRKPILGLLLGLACLAHSQTSGTYTAPGATPQGWSISPGHALIWDGKPYLPTGLRIDGEAAKIQEAQKAGVTDLIVDLPASGLGWKDAFAALEAGHSRYFVSLNSLAPMAHGYAVEPEAYRITGLTTTKPINLSLPGCQSVLVVLVTRRDNDIQKQERIKLKDGELNYLVKPGNDLEHILYIYPETSSLETPDCWEGLDAHRDGLMAALRQSAPGAGFRGLINPAGQIVPLHPNDLRFVPSSPYFHVEYRAFLEAKYHNVLTLQRTWAMRASGIDDFDGLARLVPLWSPSGVGVPLLWDPTTDRTYLVDHKRSRTWHDLREMVGSAITRRFTRLVGAVRSVTNVPVMQDWAGWSSLTEGDAPFDGIGMQASGSSPSLIAAGASRATSSVMRWKKPGLLIATRVRADKESFANVLEDLTSLGARGCFFEAADIATAKAAMALTPLDGALSEVSPTPLFFPENAMNPAQAQRLPFGSWWLPSPANGNRLDLGTHFFGYRMDDGERTGTVLWTNLPPGRYKLHMASPMNAKFSSIDGSNVNPRAGKGFVEVTMTKNPLIITGTEEIPIPDLALNETNARFMAMLAIIEGGRVPATAERYLFGAPLKAFDRNPGGSFTTMRDQYQKMVVRIAPFTWIEAESTRDHNYSGGASLPECSGNAALFIRSRFDDPTQQYSASYKVLARSGAEQEVWVAAKLPPGAKTGLAVDIGGQILRIESGPLSPYGSGFAWYKMGTTRLSSGSVRISVFAEPGADGEIAVDTVLLYPGKFSPNGVTIPDPIDFEVAPVKKKKGGE